MLKGSIDIECLNNRLCRNRFVTYFSEIKNKHEGLSGRFDKPFALATSSLYV